MTFEGKIILAAHPLKVWDFLLDIDRFSSCVPGVEEVKKLDERTFAGTLSASVGPISGAFNFCAAIVESHPPTQMVASLEGTDSVTKSKLQGTITMTLGPLAQTQTELIYHANVGVQGRLAILGDMILRTTATLLIEEFLRKLRAQLQE